MKRLLRWVVPDLIEPTPLDTLVIALHGALAQLPYVLDSGLRKALLAPSWADFDDMATADERNVIRAFLKVAHEAESR